MMFCVNPVIDFYEVWRKTKLLIIFFRNIGSPLRRLEFGHKLQPRKISKRRISFY